MHTEAIRKLQAVIIGKKTHKCTNKNITIKEPNESAALNHVVIEGISGDVIAIELDKIGFAKTTFAEGYGAVKSCDAVIFCQLEGQGYILILDLKSSSPSNNGHVSQLLSGDCFADYLLGVLERFEGIKTNWERRYFIFHCANNKRPTLPDFVVNPPSNTKANKAHILEVANGEPIHLRKLLHKPL
jgi:hypothetical protein